MRVRFIAQTTWPAVGGMEAFLHDLSSALATSHEVRILARRITQYNRTRVPDGLAVPPPFDAFCERGVWVEQLSLPPFRRALLAPMIMEGLPITGRFAWGSARIPAAAYFARVVGPTIARSCRDADVVHMWGPDHLSTAAVRAAHHNGQPVVVTPFIHAGQWGDDPASIASYRAADGVVALHETDAEACRGVGIPAERIHICGVCSPGISPGGGPALRERLGISGPLVLFLGVKRPYKGWNLLLEAAPAVVGEHPDARFAFVGPGPRLPRPLPPGVLDVGTVDNMGRAAWFDAATVVCLPSSFEILPVTILESWSIATPVITSDIASLSALVGDAGGGLAVPRTSTALADAILQLLADRHLCQTLGDAGKRAWEQRFRPEVVAASHEKLYRALGSTG